MDAGFFNRQVRSTTETFGVGTRKAIPVSLPLSAGITLTWIHVYDVRNMKNDFGRIQLCGTKAPHISLA